MRIRDIIGACLVFGSFSYCAQDYEDPSSDAQMLEASGVPDAPSVGETDMESESALAAATRVVGVDRPGFDYRDFDLPWASSYLCRDNCNEESQCKAYTYVKPGVVGPNAHCWLKSSIPAAVPHYGCTSGVKVSGIAQADVGIDRPGGDYTHFALPYADYRSCRDACDQDPNCKSYTYAKPGIMGSTAHCWLKNSVVAAVANSCCTSGVKHPGVGTQFDTDRPGGDYANFALAAPLYELCRAACDREKTCAGYTYTKPGVFGPSAHCWLKSTIVPAVHDPCCISGARHQ
jgi:hypothetical protein